MNFLFRTSESDDQTFYKDANGNFHVKRYGLPIMPVTNEYARNEAWFHANRRGDFYHLRYFKEGDNMPYLSNPEAQQFIVNRLLNN